MFFRSRSSAASLALAATGAFLVSAAPVARAAAQQPPDGSAQAGRAGIKAVEFHGVHSVNKGELKDAVSTHPSHCLSLIFKPVCLFTKSPYFYERRYFDPLEFRRDVLRVLVFYYRRGWRDATVDTTVTRDAASNTVRVRFDVVEGPPTVVDTVIVAGLQGA